MARRRTVVLPSALIAWWRLLCGTTSIRDVIAFPKTQKGQDLMAQSPTPVTAKQLRNCTSRP